MYISGPPFAEVKISDMPVIVIKIRDVDKRRQGGLWMNDTQKAAACGVSVAEG